MYYVVMHWCVSFSSCHIKHITGSIDAAVFFSIIKDPLQLISGIKFNYLPSQLIVGSSLRQYEGVFG
ncbi:hypothetical protein L1987_80106 [Smallanthus sonchifolius]|uniref:Uncharacterized protein n=1 Tax=Smallanthus sonchifolius TaxID=185202 RepID=A0ACB8YMZ0_9ASTR|nr:hypothetical protein L1987_80106 [Smallanthus sonchifolius]